MLGHLSAGFDTRCGGVQIGPGETQFTRMSRPIGFCASDFVKAWIAPLVLA